MPPEVIYHVVPTDGGWSLQREGDGYSARYYTTKERTIQEAERETASHQPCRLIIHNDDGRIAEERVIGPAKVELAS